MLFLHRRPPALIFRIATFAVKVLGVYKALIRQLLFLLPPESAHHFTMVLFRIALAIPGMKLFFRKAARHSINISGLDFPNRVGLGAGFDKNALYLDLMPWLGFGHVEIGTVTPLPQEGNPKPRLFRLPGHQALVNRMGFNNDGVDKIATRLKRKPKGLIIGGNIGKNKSTPNDSAAEDYETCMRKLHGLVDYFTLNVSSPNTPGLRELQSKEHLGAMLRRLQEVNRELGSKPVFLKISPDLTKQQLDDVAEAVISNHISGVVAANTTTDPALFPAYSTLEGGLSGKPLAGKANETLRYLASKSNGKFSLIASGGIMSVEEAKSRLDNGASLVQVWTGLIYEGPRLIMELARI